VRNLADTGTAAAAPSAAADMDLAAALLAVLPSVYELPCWVAAAAGLPLDRVIMPGRSWRIPVPYASGATLLLRPALQLPMPLPGLRSLTVAHDGDRGSASISVPPRVLSDVEDRCLQDSSRARRGDRRPPAATPLPHATLQRAAASAAAARSSGGGIGAAPQHGSGGGSSHLLRRMAAAPAFGSGGGGSSRAGSVDGSASVAGSDASGDSLEGLLQASGRGGFTLNL
jgi:hypothetical protein